MQLEIAFLEVPSPSANLWAQLEEAHRLAALEVLARLIAQAAAPERSPEGNDDD